MEPIHKTWTHSKTANDGQDWWHRRLTEHTGLFVSLSQLSGICTVKYSQTNDEGDWYATIREEVFYYQPLMQSGYTEENVSRVLAIACRLQLQWTQDMVASYTRLQEEMLAVCQDTKADETDWYTPYGRLYNSNRYRTRILSDGTVLTISKKTDTSFWKYETRLPSGMTASRYITPDDKDVMPELIQQEADRLAPDHIKMLQNLEQNRT